MPERVNERRRSADRALAAQQAVARVLAEAGSLEEALPRLLQAICQALGWHVGAVWLLDERSRALRCSGFWRSSQLRMDGFETASRKLSIVSGSGLPGHAWASRAPLWIADLSRSRGHPRAAAAVRSGLRAGFAVPVRAGQTVYGAAEFYTGGPRPVDPDLLEMMEVVGGQIGLFIRQKRGEQSLRESEQRYRLLYNSVNEAILVYDAASRRILEANDAALGLYRYTRPELLRLRVDELFFGGEPPFRSDGTMPSAITAFQQRKDKSSFPADLTAASFEPGDGTTGVLVVRDITERRQAEEAERLRQSERMQREFVATVSHEFRTPVAAIKGFAETLKNGGLQDQRNRVKFVSIIEKHAHRLSRLIEDILELSALESGKRVPKPEAIGLRRFVKRIARGLSPLLARKRLSVRVVVPESARVLADKTMLAQVLQNLFSNGIKFSPVGGRIVVASEGAGEHLCVSVSDAGPGISSQDLPHIFERFNVAKKVERNCASGTGLGLSIVKQIVEAHGGRVWAESARSRGATFHVTLPRVVK